MYKLQSKENRITEILEKRNIEYICRTDKKSHSHKPVISTSKLFFLTAKLNFFPQS